MNAYFLHRPDGTKTENSACGACGRPAGPGNFDLSERCCACLHCGKQVNNSGRDFSLIHDACEPLRDKEIQEKRLSEATEYSEPYSDPVCCEEAGTGSYGDGYFENVEELAQHLDHRKDDSSRPLFAFCCERYPFSGLDTRDWLENAAQELGEDAEDHFSGVDELTEAVEKFNALNSSMCGWHADFDHKVKIPARALGRQTERTEPENVHGT